MGIAPKYISRATCEQLSSSELTMESLTSCEVCLEEYSGLRRPMVVCLNGHSFCSLCSEKLTICAQCRQSCLPQKIVNIALLRIVEQNAQAHNSVPHASQVKESEALPSQQPIYTEGRSNFDESDDIDSVFAQWRDEARNTSDEDEQLEEELQGATGLFPGGAGLFTGAAEFLQGATGLLFQE